MSPSAVTSQGWKFATSRANEFGKRVVPIVWRVFPDGDVPRELAKMNWLFFDDIYRNASDTQALFVAIGQVLSAITTDIDWVRAHTRHIARAELWHARDRPDADFLLSGAEINAAQSWANRKSGSESIPTLFFDHLDASLAKAVRELEELNARERRISARTQQRVAMEAQRALDAGAFARAIRLALAGEPTVNELTRGIEPERMLRDVLSAAALKLTELSTSAQASEDFRLGSNSDSLVHAASRSLLVAEQNLTDEEILILRPILGDHLERNVAVRWIGPSVEDGNK